MSSTFGLACSLDVHIHVFLFSHWSGTNHAALAAGAGNRISVSGILSNQRGHKFLSQINCHTSSCGYREKYVSRAEYDELKNRLDYLDSTLTRLIPGYIPSYGSRSSMASPTMPKAPVGTVDPAQATVMTPYHAHGALAYPNYRGIAPSSSAIQSEPPILPPGQLPSAPPNRSPVGLNRPPTFMPPLSGTPAQRSYPRATSTSPTLSSSSRPSEARALGSRRASLSLAAITSPFTPDVGSYNKPKNHQAQTLPSLGRRLRQKATRTGPATVNHHRVPKGSCTPTASRARSTRRRVLALRPHRRGSSRNSPRETHPTYPLAGSNCLHYILLGIMTTDMLAIPLGMPKSTVQDRLETDTFDLNGRRKW